MAIFPLDLHAVSGETARRRARNSGFVAFWEVDRMSRGLGNEIIETLEEARKAVSDDDIQSRPVWDEKLASELIGKVVLVGLTHYNSAQP